MLEVLQNGERCELNSPVDMPNASAFLWNRKMLIQLNCRGYAVAQHMQPEPAKYSYAPNLEAKTFMQPEQAFYAHHPGRFVYIKDPDDGELFSVPYEPVRNEADSFVFSAGKSDIEWRVVHRGIEVVLELSLPVDDPVELWRLTIRNRDDRVRKLKVYPYFSIGYMSWMNQSARYDEKLGGIVASCVAPYQKLEDYPAIKEFKDKTYLLPDVAPESWETRREAFEGEGGLHDPDGCSEDVLSNREALYETPAAIFQYGVTLDANEDTEFRFIFGPAKDLEEIDELRNRYLSPGGFGKASTEYESYLNEGEGCLKIETPDQDFDNFVNYWLDRQVFYHGELNRLSTDPQTRNYLQDAMGMSYIRPDRFRGAFIRALSQQEKSGAMPDGILLNEYSSLKYINQVPHTDHCVWLPICLKAYLDETGDYVLLDANVESTDRADAKSVFDRLTNAMRWLAGNRDSRGLSYIAQGDWCDPMNMVGHKGKGVSGWLSIATIYALKTWVEICEAKGEKKLGEEFSSLAEEISEAVNKHLWDGKWFARGITDDGVSFGTDKDPEGKIFLNPQSWALMAGCADQKQAQAIVESVEKHLETPYGAMMLAPSFSDMREDIGRVTQKHPGTAENGSVYNHAAAFYVFGLYEIGESDRAFKNLRQMIPGPDENDYLRRGQLPVFMPNYYRGAYHQMPEVAGRSSQLLNTGTVSWFYRILVEELFGVRGTRDGLLIEPQLPSHWENASIARSFRGAKFEISFERNSEASEVKAYSDGVLIEGNLVTDIEQGREYTLKVHLPNR